jgi:hypothetical protein
MAGFLEVETELTKIERVPVYVPIITRLTGNIALQIGPTIFGTNYLWKT